MEVFLIQRRDKYHSGLRFREGYKRRLVESWLNLGIWRYSMTFQTEVPRESVQLTGELRGRVEQLQLAVVPASLG